MECYFAGSAFPMTPVFVVVDVWHIVLAPGHCFIYSRGSLCGNCTLNTFYTLLTFGVFNRSCCYLGMALARTLLELGGRHSHIDTYMYVGSRDRQEWVGSFE